MNVDRPPKEVLRDLYVGKKMSVRQVAAFLKIDRHFILRWLVECGIPRRTKSEAAKLNPNTGLKRNQSLSENGHWKGGRFTVKRGYVRALCHGHPRANQHGYVPEQVLVAEKTIGRYLAPGEVVHHINGNKGDNRPENLMVFPSNSAHMSHHMKLRKGKSA